MAKKTYVLDTNVYLSDPTAFKNFGRNDVVIPLKVLEEIDKHKKRQDGVGANARHTIRLLDEYRVKLATVIYHLVYVVALTRDSKGVTADSEVNIAGNNNYPFTIIYFVQSTGKNNVIWIFFI